MSEPKSRKLVVLGWDAADWKVITPLLDAGEMPNLQALIEGGVMGSITSLTPMHSPMLWTTIGSGRPADAHGILGFLEPDPVSGGVRPVTSTSRKVKAIWNILNQSGYRPHVISWFASHPAEPINGVCVSEMFCKATAAHGQPWPVRAGSVHPAELTDTLAELRIHAGDLTGADLLPFVPDIAKIDQKKDKRLIPLAIHLAECITTHAITTWVLETQPWDFVAAYFTAIDHISHHYMAYHPPRMEQVSEEDFALFRHVVNGIYQFHDLMLGRVRQLAGPDAAIMIVSDHGFHSDHLRPTHKPEITVEEPLIWHRPHGVFCLAGPGIRRDELVHGASLLDITPTILALPAAEDMPGRPLAEIFEEPPPTQRIPSWEQIPGETGQHAPDSQPEDPWEAEEVVRQLAALGYIEAPGENAERMLRFARLHKNFNLARHLLSRGKPAEAIPLFEDLVREQPKYAVLRLHLAQACLSAGRPGEARRIVEELLEENKDRPVASMLMSTLCMMSGDSEGALEHLTAAERASRPTAPIRNRIGGLYLRLNRADEAERAFRSAIEMDPGQANAHAGLAAALLWKGQPKEAAEAALDAVGLKYDAPHSHYLLGVALARLGRIPRAVQALETCLALRPNSPAAHDWLAAIHEQAGGDPDKAEHHRAQARELRAARAS